MTIYRTHIGMGRICRGVLTALALMAITTLPLAAQRWHSSVGGGNPSGEIGNAVIEAANGDIVTAGASHTPLGGKPLAYVVRMDPDGNLLWHFTYDVNGYGYCTANDIKEYPNGDFAIAGSTNNGGTMLAFAMRINSGGGLVWCTLLTVPKDWSEGTGVVIAQQGNGNNTFPGDVILCGLRDPNTISVPLAMLVRLNAGGGFVWGRVYDFGTTPGGKFSRLYGVDEAQIGPGTGDIVAVGSCDDIWAGFQEDVLYLRVDGSNGAINATPQGAALFGGTKTDIGYSIQELRLGANPGTVAITGLTEGRPAPSSTSELFVTQAYDDPCHPSGLVASRYYGDNGAGQDWGTCVREIPSPAIGTVGNVIVSGTTTAGNYWPSLDAFIQEFQEGTMAPLGARSEYGGVGSEEGRSVTPVQWAPTTPGFALAGSATSGSFVPPGNVLDLYVVKSNAAGTSACSTYTQTMSDAATGWAPACATPTIPQIPPSTIVTPGTTATPATWSEWVSCYTPFKTARPEHDARENTGTAIVELRSYPNPTGSTGGMLLGYTLTSPADVRITVSDMMGREVFASTVHRNAGTITEPIATTGWAAGSYMVRITSGSAVAATRIVIGQ